MFGWLRKILLGRAAARYGTESDVEPDTGQARIRATGGQHRPGATDAHTTTGPSPNDVFVGRIAGEDTGYLDTGAEHRAEQRKRDRGPADQ